MGIYNVDELKERLSCKYPKQISELTDERRLFNIQSFQRLICGEIEKNELVFGKKEERILLFTTKVGEKVFIQFPGKETQETLSDGRIKHPFDLRPTIEKPDGTKVKDFTFKDLWIVVEIFNEIHKDFNTPLSCLFFRQGRMNIHKKVSENYTYEIIEDGVITSKGTIPFEWYSLDFEDDLRNTFHFFGEKIKLDEKTIISLETFIYFFELLLNNEDNKYWYRKGNLTSGRVKTSESMLLLSTTLNGTMRVSELLQRFINGLGVPSCSIKEITPSTGDLVKIINPIDELCSILDENGIKYQKNGNIDYTKYLIKISSIKTIIPRDRKDSEYFKSLGWNVYNIQKDGMFSEKDIEELKTLIKKRKENPDGLFFFFYKTDTQE